MVRFTYVKQPSFIHPWLFEFKGAMSVREFDEVRFWCIERFGFGLDGKNEIVDMLANSTRTIYMFKDEKAAMEFRLKWC